MELLKNSKIAIINGLIFNDKFHKGTVLIRNKKIKKIIKGEITKEKIRNYKIIDAENCYVSFGFFDPHVHFRCPGYEYKEDWDTGSKAAVMGGYAFIVDMPNNNPSAVDVNTLLDKNNLAKKTKIHYGFYLGLTDSNAFKIKDIYKKLKSLKVPLLGIKVFLGSSTGNLLIADNNSIYRSLDTSLINLFHCEDQVTLDKYRQIKYSSVKDHNKYRPPEAEVNGIKRIIESAKKIKKKSKIYICHVSSKDQINVIERYRSNGFKIIAEVTPHHIFFNLSDIKNSNLFKVNPPIREKIDVDEVRNKFNNGFFQIIGTDHAPHLKKEKESKNPPSGFPGLESSFYALYNLYENKIISLENIFKLLTSGYKIFGIKNRGKIKKGNYADITIIKKKKNIFTSYKTFTKADFSPFDGLKTGCKIDTVIIDGEIILENGELK